MSDTIKDQVRDRLDPRCLVAVLTVGIIEFEAFNLSGQMAIVAGNDAWLSVLLGGLITSLITFFLVRLADRFPRKNLFQYSRTVWGKPITYLIVAAYLIFWGSYLCALFKNSIEINNTFFLCGMPILFSLVLLAVGAVWLVSYGLAALVRYFQLMFPFMVLPMLLIFALSIRSIKFHNFLPLLGDGLMPVLKGALLYVSFLQGLEVLLFIAPFLTNTKAALKPALIGVNLINLLIFTQVAVNIGVLGVKSTQELVWPSLSMLSYLELPSWPSERFDLLLSLPTLVAAFTTISLVLYLLSYSIIQVFGIDHRKTVISLTAIAAVAGTYLIPNFAWTIKFRHYIDISTPVFIFIIPLLTLILAILRRKSGEKS